MLRHVVKVDCLVVYFDRDHLMTVQLISDGGASRHPAEIDIGALLVVFDEGR